MWEPPSDVLVSAGNPGPVAAAAATGLDAAHTANDIQVLFATDTGRPWHTLLSVEKGGWQPYGDVVGQIGELSPVTALAAAHPSQAAGEAQFLLAT